jgi:hypothetical protein
MSTEEAFAVALAVNDGYQAGVLAATKLGAFEERERIVSLLREHLCGDAVALIERETK